MGVTSFFLCTFAPVMKNRLLYTFLLPFLVLIGLAAMMFLPELEIAGYTLKPVNLLSDVGVSSSKLHSPLMDEEPQQAGGRFCLFCGPGYGPFL